MPLRKIITSILLIGSLILLGNLLWWRFRLGLGRYFDPDELAYLHWAHNVFSGKIPAVDFAFGTSPLFLYLLAPIYLLGVGLAPVIAGRVLALGIFVALLSLTGNLFWQTRRVWWGAILAAVILAFLPLPADKFLEIRPDILMMLLVVAGISLEIDWLRTGKRSSGFFSGLSYGLSVLVMQKSLPNIAVGIVVAILALIPTNGQGQRILSRGWDKLRPFFGGLLVPLIGLLVWIGSVCLARGPSSLGQLIYSFTKFLLEVGLLAKSQIMLPDLFFNPNPTYYGTPGLGAGFLTNHFLWLLGLGFGTYRLITPLLTKDKANPWVELLIAGNLFAQVFFYAYLYPLKHTQYLIPEAIFVAFYVADALVVVWRQISWSKLGAVAGGILFILAGFWLVAVNAEVNQPKLARTNATKLAQMHHLWQIIPAGSYVLDLDGSTIYYQDPYFISADALDFVGFMSRPPPDLASVLEQTQTNYVYLGERGGTIAPWQNYLAKNFHADPNALNLLVRN